MLLNSKTHGLAVLYVRLHHVMHQESSKMAHVQYKVVFKTVFLRISSNHLREPTMLWTIIACCTVYLYAKVSLGVAVDVYCFATQNCAPGTSTFSISASRCCIDNAGGLSFKSSLSSEGCTSCVVYGFMLDDGRPALSLIVPEGKQQTSASFGIIKGNLPSPRSVTFTAIPGTAKVGDFTASYPLTPSRIYGADNRVPIIFSARRNNVALEGNKAFQLSANMMAAGTNEFIVSPLNVTVIDTDIMNISFLVSSVTVLEADGGVTLRLHVGDVDSAIPVGLKVTPLTFDQMRARKLQPPVDCGPLPAPAVAFAERSDFSSTPQVVFITREKDISVKINITKDDVNEAEEGFVVLLELLDPKLSSTVDLSSSNITLVRIIDDDVIYIDFEETTYNFTERSFDVDYPCAVKLAKLNGTRSEQTIKVAIRADCLSSGCSAVSLSAGAVTIEPHQEIVNIPLQVLSDFVVENVEYINLSATLNEPAMSPRVRVGGGSPAVLAVTDDDIIMIDFTANQINVIEGHSAPLCCRIDYRINGSELSPFVSIATSIDMILNTADAEDISISSTTFDVLSNRNTVQCVNLTAVNDSLYEGTESLSFRLRVTGNEKSRVVLISDLLTVFIMDHKDD